MCQNQKEKMVLKGDSMRKLLEKFFQHYLTERNLEATLAVLTEDVVSVGTGEQEISRNKGERIPVLRPCIIFSMFRI